MKSLREGMIVVGLHCHCALHANTTFLMISNNRPAAARTAHHAVVSCEKWIFWSRRKYWQTSLTCNYHNIYLEHHNKPGKKITFIPFFYASFLISPHKIMVADGDNVGHCCISAKRDYWENNISLDKSRGAALLSASLYLLSARLSALFICCLTKANNTVATVRPAARSSIHHTRPSFQFCKAISLGRKR